MYKVYRVHLLAVNSTFNFWGAYKVVDSESFNFYFLGFWASEFRGFELGLVGVEALHLRVYGLRVYKIQGFGTGHCFFSDVGFSALGVYKVQGFGSVHRFFQILGFSAFRVSSPTGPGFPGSYYRGLTN